MCILYALQKYIFFRHKKDKKKKKGVKKKTPNS